MFDQLIQRARDEWLTLWREDADQGKTLRYVHVAELPSIREAVGQGCRVAEDAAKNHYGEVAAVLAPDGTIYAFAPNLDAPLDEAVVIYTRRPGDPAPDCAWWSDVEARLASNT